MGWMEFWRPRASRRGCNCVVARRRSSRPGAAARLVLRRMWLAVIAGIAAKEQRLRRIDFGGAGRALAASSLALNSRSSLWRPISRSRFRGNALPVTSARDLGNHQGSLTNSSSSPAVMPLWRSSFWPRRLAKLDRAVPLSNPPLHRTKPASICPEHKGSRGTRAPVYYRPAVQGFAGERQTVSQTRPCSILATSL